MRLPVRHYFVYIMASKKHGTIYVGVTNHLVRRAIEHRLNLIDGFTKKYAIHMLVHYELFTDINLAIQREKQLKNWHRQWKINLIEATNPEWNDLFPDVY